MQNKTGLYKNEEDKLKRIVVLQLRIKAPYENRRLTSICL